jgi:hypothetical protein
MLSTRRLDFSCQRGSERPEGYGDMEAKGRDKKGGAKVYATERASEIRMGGDLQILQYTSAPGVWWRLEAGCSGGLLKYNDQMDSS